MKLESRRGENCVGEMGQFKQN